MRSLYTNTGSFMIMGEDDSIYYSEEDTLKSCNLGSTLKGDIRQYNYSMQVIAETTVLGCFMLKPSLINDYNLKPYLWTRWFYMFYPILKRLHYMGVEKIKESDFLSVAKHYSFPDYLERYGVYKSIAEFSNMASIDRIDRDVADMIKYSVLREFDLEGFNIFDNYDELEKMESSEVFSYFENQLNTIEIFD